MIVVGVVVVVEVVVVDVDVVVVVSGEAMGVVAWYLSFLPDFVFVVRL